MIHYPQMSTAAWKSDLDAILVGIVTGLAILLLHWLVIMPMHSRAQKSSDALDVLKARITVLETRVGIKWEKEF